MNLQNQHYKSERNGCTAQIRGEGGQGPTQYGQVLSAVTPEDMLCVMYASL